MSEIVHITFEKLTGLKGTIEGAFLVFHPEHFDLRLPLVFVGVSENYTYIFSHNKRIVQIASLPGESFRNYAEHIRYGVNFLIKSWSNGRGEPIKHSNSPN